jgi:hypothetical protein
LCNAEDGMDKFALAYSITARQPSDLSLPYRMHRTLTLDRSQRTGTDRNPGRAGIRFLLKR